MCPVDGKSAKLANKYAGIIFSARSRLDKGLPMDIGNFTNLIPDDIYGGNTLHTL